MTKQIRTCRRVGFTLIEVLATLLLVGIVLPIAMEAIATASAAASIARSQAQAAALAETKLNELIISGEFASGGGSGDFSPDWPDYHWTSQAIERDTGVTEVQVVVSWPWRGDERSVMLSTLVYRSIAQQ